MYGFFETSPNGHKRLAFNGEQFGSIVDALDAKADIIVHFEVEPDESAADVFTKFGAVYAIERVAS